MKIKKTVYKQYILNRKNKKSLYLKALFTIGGA